MIMNVNCSAGLTPINSSVANINGRIYKEVPSSLGIQLLSNAINSFNPSINKSSGTAGIPIRSADTLKRFQLS